MPPTQKIFKKTIRPQNVAGTQKQKIKYNSPQNTKGQKMITRNIFSTQKPQQQKGN